MGSTELFIGLGEGKSSSKVLKPPGGASSNIFGAADEIKPHARPKYDQQNSSNLNFCMNTVDPNIKVKLMTGEEVAAAAAAQANYDPAPQSAPAVDNIKAQEASAPPPKAEANLPQCHHHRSTALW